MTSRNQTQTNQQLTQSILSSQNTEILNQQQEANNTPKTPFISAMFGMMAAALGTGIFNLPLRITQIGIIIFIIYVFVAGIFSYLGCALLQKLIDKGFKSYGEICETAYKKPMKRLLQVCIILFPWGITVCYQVIIPKFVIQLGYDNFQWDLYENRDLQTLNSKGNLVRILINIGVICTNFSLIQLKDMRTLQRLSVIGVCSVIYNTVVIFILLFTGFTHGKQNNQIKYESIFKADWSIFQWVLFQAKAFSVHTQAIASIIFCYINHQMVFPTCQKMENPTKQRLNACFYRSNLYQLILYVVIGLSGYMLLMQHQNILPIGPMVLTSIDFWPITIGKLLMIVTLYLAIPLNLFPARTILKQALGLQNNNKNHYLLCIFLAVSTCTVAISFVGVNSYFGLLGGTTGVLIGCGIPALCYYKLIMKQDKSKQTILNYGILVFALIVTLIAFVGAILSVADPV